MYEILTEEMLLEHIPRDLYQAYKEANRYNSTQHQETAHDTVSSSNRRSTAYKYGDATYKVITYDEALRLVNENPHNVEYLRGIKDGELVEYEYQGNKFYALYANPNRAVSYQKANGDTVSKKNIRYITNPAIWLRLLDKIYWTDEYDHPVTQEEKDARSTDSKITAVGQFKPTSDLNYNRFRPFDHYSRNIKAMRQNSPDTGNHGVGAINRYDKDSSNYVAYSDSINKHLSIDSETQEIVRAYKSVYDEKQNYFIELNAARKSLKKLERDRDDYDDAEYTELKSRYEKIYKSYLSLYQDAALRLSRLKTQLTKYYESAGNSFAEKYSSVLAQLQDALYKCEELKKHIDDLAAKAVDSLDTSALKANYRGPERTLIDEIKTLKSDINSLIAELKQLQQQSENIEPDNAAITSSTTEDEIAQKVNIIAEKSQALEALRKNLFKLYNKTYKKAHEEMLNIEIAVNALKPTLAAKKAAKAKAAGQAVLDPAIAGIIQFEDEQPDDEEVSA